MTSIDVGACCWGVKCFCPGNFFAVAISFFSAFLLQKPCFFLNFKPDFDRQWKTFSVVCGVQKLAIDCTCRLQLWVFHHVCKCDSPDILDCQCYGWYVGRPASHDEYLSEDVWVTLVFGDHSTEQLLKFPALFPAEGLTSCCSGKSNNHVFLVIRPAEVRPNSFVIWDFYLPLELVYGVLLLLAANVIAVLMCCLTVTDLVSGLL